MTKKEREAQRLLDKKKRLRKILLAEVIVALAAVGAAALFAYLPVPGENAGNTAAETAKETAAESMAITDAVEEPAGLSTAEIPAETATEKGTEKAPAETSTEKETAAPETAEETTPAETKSGTVDYSQVVLIGDSRTRTLSSGGMLEFNLVPDDAVYATWGAQLTDTAAYEDTAAAASMMRPKAVFWFGINDVQLNRERDNAEAFLQNYDRLIATYRTINDGSTIYLLSILPTSVMEKDYYSGQDANIAAYNNALEQYAAERDNIVYLNLSPLYTGEECFHEGDRIHFSEDWYRERFLPALADAIGIAE